MFSRYSPTPNRILFIIRLVTISFAPYFAFKPPGTIITTIPTRAPTTIAARGASTEGSFGQIATKEPTAPAIKKIPSPPRLNKLALNITAMARPEKISGTAVSTIFPR